MLLVSAVIFCVFWGTQSKLLLETEYRADDFACSSNLISVLYCE